LDPEELKEIHQLYQGRLITACVKATSNPLNEGYAPGEKIFPVVKMVPQSQYADWQKEGFKVEWKATEGNGSVNLPESSTGENGEATVEWTLPDNLSGAASLTAEIKDKEGDHLEGSPFIFKTKVNLPQLQLVTDTMMTDNWWPDDYDFSDWYDYWEQNNGPPRIKGKLIEFIVVVIVKDSEGNPVKDVIINFSPEGGTVTPSSTKSGSDGTVTALWKFDGSWDTWGNWDLTITGFNVDGVTPLGGSPIIVIGRIWAPPGV
jgi:hypothetical protein